MNTISPSSSSFDNKSDINFSLNGNVLDVTIETERLYIRSVEASEKEYASYAALFGDKDVMDKFATGETKTKEEIQKRIKGIWRCRWEQNNPYAGMTILRKENKEFLGHIVLGYGNAPGEAELAYLLKKVYWGHGFGTEAVAAIVNEYVPATIQRGYTLKGKPLSKINATVRPDNPASEKILKKIGMNKIGEEEKYGALRHYYSIETSNIGVKTDKNLL